MLNEVGQCDSDVDVGSGYGLNRYGSLRVRDAEQEKARNARLVAHYGLNRYGTMRVRGADEFIEQVATPNGDVNLEQNIKTLASSIAGCFAGVSSVLVGHPFDSIKTRLQVGKRVGSGNNISFEGLRGLYRGVIPPLLTVGMVQSLNFTFYEGIKRRLLANSRRRMETDEGFSLSPAGYLSRVLVAGSGGGAVVFLVTCPVGLVKVNQQIATKKNMINVAQELYKKHGARVFYRGGVAGFLMEWLGRVSVFNNGT
mmetsp:Transcript_2040/g.3658  ORF Transcript_2040/g.3658 Transcript_2040/m.3658 type:complete len:255 (-) Transcript_2040:1135-1899(-)